MSITNTSFPHTWPWWRQSCQTQHTLFVHHFVGPSHDFLFFSLLQDFYQYIYLHTQETFKQHFSKSTHCKTPLCIQITARFHVKSVTNYSITKSQMASSLAWFAITGHWNRCIIYMYNIRIALLIFLHGKSF